MSHNQQRIAHQRIVKGVMPAGRFNDGGISPSIIIPDPDYTGPHCGVRGCPTCGPLPGSEADKAPPLPPPNPGVAE